MTTCGELDAALVGYLAGRLADNEALALEAHAGACDRCAALLEERTRLPVTLPPEVPIPEGLRATTLAAVARRQGRRRTMRWLVPPAIAATLMLGFALTRPADKAAMMREREHESPLAMAMARAFPEFEAIAAARSEIERAMERADPSERRRLDTALRRITRQYDALVRLVQEFES